MMEETEAHLNKTLRGFKTSSAPEDDSDDLCGFNYTMQMWRGAHRDAACSGSPPLLPEPSLWQERYNDKFRQSHLTTPDTLRGI